jgi:hypothetical protein
MHLSYNVKDFWQKSMSAHSPYADGMLHTYRIRVFGSRFKVHGWEP